MTKDPLPVSYQPDSPEYKIISQILSEIYSRFRLDLSQDPVAMERIDKAVLKALQELESREVTEINIPFISANSSGPIHLEISVSRDAIGYEKLPDDMAEDGGAGKAPAAEPPPQPTRIELPDRKPRVTTAILVITIIIYLVQILTDYLLGTDIPADLGKKANDLILAGEYWRLITPVFLHGPVIHLMFNMYALSILGRRVERFFGSFRFLCLYVAGGLAGNIFSFFFTSAPSLGSSSAIFGILGAEGVFIYQHRDLYGDQFRVALRQIVQIAGINLFIGLIPGIDNWGHIGGLIGGAAFTWFGGPRFSITGTAPLLKLEDKRSPQSSLITFTALVAVLAGLVFLIISYK